MAMLAARRPGASKRAAIYIRVSDSSQESNTSLGEQRTGCESWCQAKGYTVSPEHTYADVASGDDYFVRPGFQALRAAMRRHEFDCLVFYRVDRTVARGGIAYWGAFQVEALENGVWLECVTEPTRNLNLSPDPSAVGDDGSHVEAIQQIFDAYKAKKEKADLVARTSGGRKQRALAGKLIPGNLPKYGYRWADSGESGRGGDRKTHYAIDPVTGRIVVYIYEMAADGLSTRRIVEVLNGEGVPCPGQARAGGGALTAKHQAYLARHATGRWARTTVRRILADTAYQGVGVAFRHAVSRVRERDAETGTWALRHHREERAADDPARVELPEGVIPRLVSDELAMAARAQLARNTNEQSGHPTDPDAGLLRGGFARCGYCGGSMAYGRHLSHSGTRPAYRCSTYSTDRARCPHGHTVAVGKLDALVWGAIRGLLMNPAAYRQRLAGRAQEGRQEADTNAEALAGIDQTLDELARRRSSLLDRLERAADTAEQADIEQRLDRLAGQIAEKQQQREQLARAERTATARVRRIEDFVTWSREEAATLDALTMAERRQRLRKLDVCVRVWRADHRPRVTLTVFSGLHATARRTLDRMEAARDEVAAPGTAKRAELDAAFAVVEEVTSGHVLTLLPAPEDDGGSGGVMVARSGCSMARPPRSSR